VTLPPLDIRPGRSPHYPAGPPFLPRILSGEAFRSTSADLMLSSAQTYGDLVYYRAFGRHIYQLNHPDLIRDFLTTDAPHHHRNLVMQRARTVLGNGLLTSEEPLHMRQRRLAQPAFHRDRIAGYGIVISDTAARMCAKWHTGTTRNLHADMLELALRIVGKCLFDLDHLDNIEAVAAAVDSFMGFLPLAFLPFSHAIQRLPIPSMRRLQRGKLHLDTLITRMIATRRADPPGTPDRGDLLSMLLAATDPEDATAASNKMTDQQIHDECVTILLAGHETTANALSFALYLLATHPEAQEQLHDEAIAVLGPDRNPTAADYPQLPFATQVFAEAMRLYPPVWVTARTCISSYRIAGYQIPVGAALLAPQFAVHRDPRFFPDPTRFDPSRFTPDRKAELPRYAFFPFAGGGRQCIAEGLAWMEGTLTLATIARSWCLRSPPNAPAKLDINPAISLRPRHGLPIHLDRRTA
jgi:cytochrome P450